MCDIYSHKCDAPGCKEEIGMHLGDFKTERDEIEVYCHKHYRLGLCTGKGHAVLSVYVDDDEELDINDREFPLKLDEITPKICVVVSLTENAKDNKHHNYPNSFYSWEFD